MGITQIGARLIRSFGSGENLRKIVTETVNGKTYTRVLDKDGNIVKERVKQIVRNQQVGNKKVNTVTKIISRPESSPHKLVYDRVYSAEGEFLGSRATMFNIFSDGIEKDAVLKNRVGGNSFLKWFASGGKVASKVGGCPAGARPRTDIGYNCSVHYNDKGLPVPQWKNDVPEDVKGMSLKEMRDLHLKTHPEVFYAAPGSGLEFLDKPTEGLATMNDLDKFI